MGDESKCIHNLLQRLVMLKASSLNVGTMKSYLQTLRIEAKDIHLESETTSNEDDNLHPHAVNSTDESAH